MTTATHDLVVLEVEVPPTEGAFIIGLNKVGDRLTAAGVGPTWQPLTDHTTRIDVRRGGTRDGVVAVLDVGTLTAVFLDAYSPLDSDLLAPHRLIRLRTHTGQPIFTGRIVDITMTDTKPTADQPAYTWTTITAADGIRSTRNTRIPGAISGNGNEPWAARIRRLCASAETPANPPQD